MTERFLEVPDPARYIQDQPRRLGQQEFGIPLPTFRARYNTNPLHVIGSDNQYQLTWDWWEIGDDRFFAEDSFDSDDRLASWRLTVPGLYMITASIRWKDPSTWDTTLIINDPYRNTLVTHASTANAFDDFYAISAMRDFLDFDVYNGFIDPDSPPTSVEMILSVNQNSGINQDLYQADIVIAYLGGMSVPSPTRASTLVAGDIPPQRIEVLP